MTEAIERLKSTITEIGPTKRELIVELSAEEAAREHEEILDSYVDRVKLRGFRQGHAPREMVQRMFGHEIEHDVIDHLVPRTLDEALEARGVRAAGVPSVREVSYEQGGPLRFKAEVEVWPEFDLPLYKGLKLKKREPVVSEGDVDKALEELRRKHADYVPVESRGARDGDYTVVERQMRDLRTKRLKPLEKVVVLVGYAGNERGLDEALAGLEPGQERTFQADPAEGSAEPKAAGKPVEVRVKVLSIKEMVFPEVNDEFAKHLGEFDTLAALRAKVREELQGARSQAARRETAQDAINAVIAGTQLELPASVVEEETAAVLKSYASQLPSRGISREAVEALKARARLQAEQNLKEHLVIRRIAQAEGLSVNEAEIDEEIRTIARANEIPPARALETFREEGRRESLGGTLLARRTVDFLVAQAIIE